MADMSNIHRWDCDENYQHYWRVKFQAAGISRIFSDGKFGCKERALIAAMSWRDKMKKKHPPEYMGTIDDRGHYEGKGVSYRFNEKTLEAKWVAFWDEPSEGKRKQRYKSFSIHKYGSAEAKKLAIEYRENKLKELYG